MKHYNVEIWGHIFFSTEGAGWLCFFHCTLYVFVLGYQYLLVKNLVLPEPNEVKVKVKSQSQRKNIIRLTADLLNVPNHTQP